MQITSKFNINDRVLFFEYNQTKFFEGTVVDIQSWDKWNGFHYDIQYIDANEQLMNYTVDENKIFNSKEEIINNLFENDITEDNQEDNQ